MSDVAQGPGWWQASDGKWYPPQPPPPPGGGGLEPGFAGAPSLGGYGYAGPAGPLGKRESIGLQFLFSVLTLGLYGIYWAYKSHEEIKRHSGDGIGGVGGVLVYIFVGIVTLFLLPTEIKRMYERSGQHSPVSAATAFWALLFVIPWYVKCQSALNQYWASRGAPA